MTDRTHGGKGSRPRPIDKQKFDNNWDAIFSKPKESPCVKECKLDKETQQCIGCDRTLEEIAEHGRSSQR